MNEYSLDDIKDLHIWNDIINTVSVGAYVYVEEFLVTGLYVNRGITCLVARDKDNKTCYITETGKVAYERTYKLDAGTVV